MKRLGAVLWNVLLTVLIFGTALFGPSLIVAVI